MVIVIVVVVAMMLLAAEVLSPQSLSMPVFTGQSRPYAPFGHVFQ